MSRIQRIKCDSCCKIGDMGDRWYHIENLTIQTTLVDTDMDILVGGAMLDFCSKQCVLRYIEEKLKGK